MTTVGHGVAYSPYADLEEARARNQSSWEQLGNGLYKAANTFAGAVSENTWAMPWVLVTMYLVGSRTSKSL